MSDLRIGQMVDVRGHGTGMVGDMAFSDQIRITAGKQPVGRWRVVADFNNAPRWVEVSTDDITFNDVIIATENVGRYWISEANRREEEVAK